ncbi:hypothetical protein ACN27F_24095 [Solwaraspora sp. WMMB335]|uniref:hypothetical protein n=1 Tax=Solwaraspora sp. WMMB335 TaxID=3404118 RepID=UPI003B92FAB3
MTAGTAQDTVPAADATGGTADGSLTGDRQPELDDLDDLDEYLPVELAPTDADPTDDGSDAPVSVRYNSGQVAGVVYGGLHQYVQRVRDYHELSVDYVRDRLDSFVEPGFHTISGERLDSGAALAAMRRYGGAVLLASPGTGRYTAALKLLHGTGQPLREIRPTFDPARREQLTIAELPVAAEQAYLLELPEQAHHIQYGFARDLGAYCHSLARRDSIIAVTAAESTWTQLGSARDGPVLRVGVPDAGQILRQRLRRLRPDLELGWLGCEPQVAELLAGAAPAEAVRLAQLAADVLATGALATGIAAEPTAPVTPDSPGGKEVVAALVSAYHNWEAELGAWFHQHNEPRQRAFLIATAALEGAPAPAVLGAAESLDSRLADAEGNNAIQYAGVRELVAAVDACLDGVHTVRFRRAGYAEAVLDFAISDRADAFSRELWRWVANLPLRATGTRPSMDRDLAGRAAELVLRTALRRRTPEIFAQVAPVWSQRVELRATLVHILGIAALSPELGAAVRQQLYRWAQVRHHPPIMITVAEVCGGQFADFYVEQALVRLGHLARHGVADTVTAVLDALGSLWRRPPLRQAVLLRLARWLGGDHPHRAALAGQALDALGCPDPTVPGEHPDQVFQEITLATPAVQDEIGVAIGRVLDQREPAAGITALLHRWFDDAAADGELITTLTHVLGRSVTAGPAAARRVARLRALLYAWPTDPPPADQPPTDQPPTDQQPVIRRDGDYPGPTSAVDASRRAALRRHLIHQLHRADPMATRRAIRPALEL